MHIVHCHLLIFAFDDRGEHRAAENYYRQSIDVYDKARGTTASSSDELDKEVPGVLFNYGQFLMHLKRWEDAEQVLRRAQSAAKTALLTNDYMVRIDSLLGALHQSDESEPTEDDS